MGKQDRHIKHMRVFSEISLYGHWLQPCLEFAKKPGPTGKTAKVSSSIVVVAMRRQALKIVDASMIHPIAPQ